MKKILFIAIMLIGTFINASAQAEAEIKFDKQTINMGEFSESNPIQKAVFTFTNIGKSPLVINQIIVCLSNFISYMLVLGLQRIPSKL